MEAVQEVEDPVTRILDFLRHEVQEGKRRPPKPDVLTLALKRVFGEKLWMPDDASVFVADPKRPETIEQRKLDPHQPYNEVMWLVRHIEKIV